MLDWRSYIVQPVFTAYEPILKKMQQTDLYIS